MRVRSKNFLPAISLTVFTLWIVWPALGGSAPAWMGAADGFVLAKARFLAQGFGLGSWNRFWFLGIPGNHIGSPLLPWVLSLVTRTVPVNGMFWVWRGMVALGVVGSVVGVWWFVRELVFQGMTRSDLRSKMSRSDLSSTSEVFIMPLFASLFTLLVPSILIVFPQIWRVSQPFGWPSWSIMSPFYLGDGQRTIAYGLLLLALVQSWILMRRWSRKRAVSVSLLGALLLLVDSLSFLTFLLWNVVFLFTIMLAPKLRTTGIIIQVSRLLGVAFLALLLSSFWFTPGYILTVLGSPSLGGKPFTTVIITLSRSLLIFLPAVFGVLAAKRWLSKMSPLTIVGLMGLLVFGSLTMAAFIADPDFWGDYSRFGRSLDLSMALVVGGLASKSKSNSKSKILIVAIGVVILLGMPFLLQRERLLRGSGALAETAEYRAGEVLERVLSEDCGNFTSEVKEIPTSEVVKPGVSRSRSDLSLCPIRAYLSGSSAFWINGWFPIAQVRGGGEMGSVNDWWPHGSFQIREGRDPELAEGWLEALGVNALAVHDSRSQEAYHDFRSPQKFSGMQGWEQVWQESGDTIFIKSGSAALSIARVVDLDVLEVDAPEKGDDLEALENYVGILGAPADMEWMGTRALTVSADLENGQGVRLAVAYSPFWQVLESSIPLKVLKDPLGMIVLRPGSSGQLAVSMRFDPWPDLLAGALLSIAGLFVLLRLPQLLERPAAVVQRLVGRESELDRTAL